MIFLVFPFQLVQSMILRYIPTKGVSVWGSRKEFLLKTWTPLAPMEAVESQEEPGLQLTTKRQRIYSIKTFLAPVKSWGCGATNEPEFLGKVSISEDKEDVSSKSLWQLEEGRASMQIVRGNSDRKIFSWSRRKVVWPWLLGNLEISVQ